MTRRKSKPIVDSDLDVSILSSQENPGSDLQSCCSTFPSSQPSLSSSQSSLGTTQILSSQHRESGEASEEGSASTEKTERRAVSGAPANNLSQNGDLHQGFKVDAETVMQSRESAKLKASEKGLPGYVANRRSAPFIIHDDSNPMSAPRASSTARDARSSMEDPRLPKSAPPLKRTASLVKISLDAEGKAEVTPRTGETPSPPHQKPVLFPPSARRSGLGLQRSFSAVDQRTCDKTAWEHMPTALGRRPMTGRSRDARTWEFYCDSDARDALTKQAEREESGSATAAIGLLRSRSQNSKTLTPNSNKRNALVQKQDSVKRHKIDKEKSSKPKLDRTTSSVARLQTSHSNTNGQKQKSSQSSEHRKSNSKSAIFEDFDADSDKENWEPGTQTRRPPRRRPVTSQESARILLESLREPSESTSFGSALSQGDKKQRPTLPRVKGKENEAPQVDDELAAFMGEGRLPREEEDLDCVQNLLRLSQAVWN